MLPLLTTPEMRAADAAEVARRGQDALVRDAGTAVALVAQAMLGSPYGAHVGVVVGPGLNGADGRVAAARLAARGAKVRVYEVANQPGRLTGCDLVIDAAFGLGCSRAYDAPEVRDAPVLAVDLPSGVDADTGRVLGSPAPATVTLALGALKFAHVSGEAAALCGEVRLARLSIPCESPSGLVEDADLVALTRRERDEHKWRHALGVLAGSDLMPGAASLVAAGALAGGATMIRLSGRGDPTRWDLPVEVVRVAEGALDPRARALVAGPGLGPGAGDWLAPLLATLSVPVVLDADALDPALLARREPGAVWVLTPHDGEFARLSGHAPGADRVRAARELAASCGCVVLLKGPTTVVASPEGPVRVVTSGTASLASAGSGDVLAGLIGALLARGRDALSAASLAAHLHGRAGSRLEAFSGSSSLPGAVRATLVELARR